MMCASTRKKLLTALSAPGPRFGRAYLDMPCVRAWVVVVAASAWKAGAGVAVVDVVVVVVEIGETVVVRGLVAVVQGMMVVVGGGAVGWLWGWEAGWWWEEVC